MPWYKHTMLFELTTNLSGRARGRHTAGWSESVYKSAPDFLALRSLCMARARFLPTSGSIIGQRIQKVFPVGASQTFGEQFIGSQTNDNDVPQLALLWTAASTSTGNARRWTTRGLPDTYGFQGEFEIGSVLLAQTAAYINELKANWKFPARDLTAPPVRIDTITEAGVVTLLDNFTAINGEKLKLRQVILHDDLKFTGTVRQRSVADNRHFTIENWQYGIAQGGTVSKIEPQFLASMEEVAITRLTIRKVGRPFTQYRGRKSKRKAVTITGP